MDDEEIARYFVFAKKVAKSIKEAFPCKKVGMSVFGLEVAHAHIHLMPMDTEGDMDFRREKLSLPANEMEEIANKIYTAFQNQNN